ncbi:phage tail tape measure protein [Paenibacillus tuaregi]|uniref:phage tail tape measure protein n=1 Tax=Paenibacillus tuaregi TaxID=1816681 RepID=UPI000839765E|nr:phage tail tape measure protein [Paenibacillus tuaregi]
MADDLKVLVSLGLNGSALQDINKELKKLSSHPSLQKLELKINMDDSIARVVDKFNQISRAGDGFKNQSRLVQELVAETVKLDGSLGRAAKQVYNHAQEVMKFIKSQDQAKRSVLDQTQAYHAQINTLKQLEKELEGYNLAYQKANRDKSGQIIGYTNIYTNDNNQKVTVKTDQVGRVQNSGRLRGYLQQQSEESTQPNSLEKAKSGLAGLRESYENIKGSAFFNMGYEAIKNGVAYIKELDQAMTELRKVTDLTGSSYEQFIKSSSRTASEVGALTVDVIKSTTEWAKLGYTLRQSQQLSKQAHIFQNVGGAKDAESAMQSLQATIRGFGITVDDQGKNVSHIVDVYNAVGGKFAITSEGISEAVTRSASTMSESGNTLEQTVAMVAAANKGVKDPGQVGDSLMTIAMRIRGISKEGEDLTGLIPKMESQFKSIGLTLKKDDNTFKSTYEIFNDLSSVWGKLGDAQQKDILGLVAGKGQEDAAKSLITNWKDAQGALQVGVNSFGSAARENEQYLDSIQGRITLFKDAVGEMWQNVSDSAAVKGVIDLGTGLIKVLAKLTDTFGGFGTIIGITSLAMLTFNNKLRDPVLSIFNGIIRTVSLSTQIFTGSTLAARAAVVGLQAAMTFGLSLGITLLVGGLTTLYEKHQENVKAMEEARKQNELVANSWINHKDKVLELVSQYENLNSVTKNGTVFADAEQESLYRDTIEQLSGLMPNLVASIDDKGNKHLKNSEAIQRELEYTKQLAKLQQEDKINRAKETFEEKLDGINEAKEDLKNKTNTLNNEFSRAAFFSDRTDESVIADYKTDVTAAQMAVLQAENEIANKTGEVRGDLQSLVEAFLNLNNVKVDSKMTNALSNMVKSLDMSKIDSGEKFFNTYKNISAAIQLIAKESITKEEKENLEQYIKVLGMTPAQLETVRDSFKETFDFTKSQERLQESFKNTSAEIKDINSALNDMNQGHALNEETVNHLVAKYPHLSNSITQVKDGWIISKKALVDLRKEKQDFFEQDMAKEQENAFIVLNSSLKRLSAYGLEFGVVTNLAGAKEALRRVEEEAAKGTPSKWKNKLLSDEDDTTKQKVLNELQVDLGGQIVNIEEIENYFKFLRQTVNNISQGIPKANATAKSSQKAANDTYKETVKILTATLERLKQIDSEQEKLLNKRTKMKKGSVEYQQSLADELKLLKEQKSLYEAGAKNPSELIEKEVDAKTKKAVSTGDKTKELADAKENAEHKAVQLDTDIYKKSLEIIDDVILMSQNKIDSYNPLIQKSQGRQSRMSGSSAEWRKEEMLQSSYLQAQQKEVENQNKRIDQLLKENKITSGEYDKQKSENSAKWWELEQQVQEKRFNVVKSNLAEYDQKIEKVKNQFDNTNAKLGLLKEGSKEYMEVLQSQTPILREEQQLHKDKIAVLNELLASDKLTAEQKEELAKQLQAETRAYYDNEAAIKSNLEQQQKLREDAADKIIEAYKNMYQKQQELENKALDERKEKEDKRHEEFKKNLEDENRAFEDSINKQMKVMDRNNASADYETELNKKLKERQTIIDKLNVLALDNSMEAKAKRKDLGDQLNAKNEEIDKYKLDREREMRKQGLQDQLDDRKKYTDKISRDEDKRNKDEMDAIDLKRREVEQYYKDILENEQNFYRLKQGLLSQDSKVVQDTLAELKVGFDTYHAWLNQNVIESEKGLNNLNNALEKSLNMLKKFASGDFSQEDAFPSGYTPPSTGTPTSPSSPSSPTKNDDVKSAWEQYLKNKKEAEDLTQEAVKRGRKNPKDPEIANIKAEIERLRKANNKIREAHPSFPNGSFAELNGKDVFSAETGGYTGDKAGKGGKFLLAHDKELVLNQTDTSRMLEIVSIARSLFMGNMNWGQLLEMKPSSYSTDNSVTIEQVIIQANDMDSGKTILNKIGEAFTSKIKLGTI